MDFKTLREKLDNLITGIEQSISMKSVSESSEKLQEARDLLISLEKIAKGEIQTRVIPNRKRRIEYLEKQQRGILSKREAG